MKCIQKYFPLLSDKQKQLFEKLEACYLDWNEKINVVSRKDIQNLHLHHILHSLSVAKFISFEKQSRIMDLGTGGGFPGIPLAILFPDVEFHLVDSIGKKVKVCREISKTLGLNNVHCFHSRAEAIEFDYDFIVTRAVAILPKLMLWSNNKLKKKHLNSRKNGLIALKGIDQASTEIEACSHVGSRELIPLKTYFEEAFFDTKCLVYLGN